MGVSVAESVGERLPSGLNGLRKAGCTEAHVPHLREGEDFPPKGSNTRIPNINIRIAPQIVYILIRIVVEMRSQRGRSRPASRSRARLRGHDRHSRSVRALAQESPERWETAHLFHG